MSDLTAYRLKRAREALAESEQNIESHLVNCRNC